MRRAPRSQCRSHRSSRHSGVRVYGAMAGGDLLVDRLVAAGFLRPAALHRGSQLRRSAHRQLLEVFAASQHRIPVGQSVVGSNLIGGVTSHINGFQRFA